LITSFSPAYGQVGTTVTITGTNFSTTPANNTVSFNGTAALVASSTSTQIVTTVPQGATTGPISVTVGGYQATSASNFTVGYLMGGSIQGISISLAGSVTTVAGTAGSAGSANGTGPAASFNYPEGITTDGTNLYVADAGNDTIRQIVIATGAVTTLAGTAGTSGSSNGTGPAASFSIPFGITTDGTNLYVADTDNNTIRQIVIATGAVTTLAGTAGTIGSANGTGPAASFNSPNGITTDGTNLYVADTRNSIIRKIVISTAAVTTLAGTAGSPGSANGTNASFNLPCGITTDGTNLYVADTSNNTIRQIVISTGNVTTLAGTAGQSGSSNGTGTEASFNSPYSITTDGTNLYVADTVNNTIRQIVISTGAVTTLAGLAGTAGSANGTGTEAGFNYPEGITKDGTSLYVADTHNNTIREVQ
jgi:hypothetical protein